MQRAARYVHGGNHRLKGGRNIELVGGRVVKRCSARSSLACMAAVTERESFTSTKRVENRGEGGGLPQSRRAPLYRRPRPVRDTTLRHSLARLLSSSYSPFFSLLRIFILLGVFFSSFFFPPWGNSYLHLSLLRLVLLRSLSSCSSLVLSFGQDAAFVPSPL